MLSDTVQIIGAVTQVLIAIAALVTAVAAPLAYLQSRRNATIAIRTAAKVEESKLQNKEIINQGVVAVEKAEVIHRLVNSNLAEKVERINTLEAENSRLLREDGENKAELLRLRNLIEKSAMPVMGEPPTHPPAE